MYIHATCPGIYSITESRHHYRKTVIGHGQLTEGIDISDESTTLAPDPAGEVVCNASRSEVITYERWASNGVNP